MKVPRLNRRMALEERVEVPNGSGGFLLNWQELGRHWVALETARGRDGGREALATGELTLRLVLRAAPEGDAARPRPGQRLREGGRVFAILAVVEADPDQRYLSCFAREEVPA